MTTGKQQFIIHLGLAKTGTTAIQHFLRSNQKRLETQDLVLLETDMRLYQPWPTSVMRNESPVSVPQRYSEARKRLSQLGKNGLHTNETFSVVCEQHPSFVKDIIEYMPECSLKLVVYLRRQDKHYESSYLQDVEYFGNPKRFHPAPPQGHKIMANGLSTDLYDYHRWLSEMRSHLRPEDELVVRLYDKKSFHEGSLFKDFILALGLKWDDEFVLPERDQNPSIDGRYAELCRKAAAYYKGVNAPSPDHFEEAPFESTLFYNIMQRINLTLGRTGNKNLFDLEERLAFLKKYEESNALVAKEFFQSTDPLFDESDLSDHEKNAKDAFQEGELEMALLLLHKIWLECACQEDLKTMNYLRLRRFRRMRKQRRDDPNAKRRLFWHKLIHSVGKRFFKNWGNVPQMEAAIWSMPSRNTSIEELKAEIQAFKELDKSN